MPAQLENNNKTKTDSNILSDFSGRFDDLGEDLMKLSSNEHICTIYRKDEDKIRTIMEFLKTGIVRNERCVIIVDKESKEDILTKIKSLKEIKNLLNTSAIVLVDSEDVYGNISDFNLSRITESIESYIAIPQDDTFSGLRFILEILPQTNKETTFNTTMELHSKIDKLISNREISFFCLYNEYKFDSRMLLDVMVTHPKLIFNGILCNNSLFMDPYQLQLIRDDNLDETLYKKTIYDIVQREIASHKSVKTVSYIQAETLKSINNSVFLLDFAGNILEVNEAAHKTRGYTEEEILSMNILDIMTSENRDLFDLRIEELKKMGEITFETTHHCKHGSILDVEFKTKIIRYDNQQFILSIGKDITERNIAEKEAKTSEEKYKMIFNNANDAMYLFCIDDELMPSNFIEINDVACKMLGYTEDEFRKMSPSDLTSKSAKKKIPKIMNKLAMLKQLTFESIHFTKEGEGIPVEISSHTFHYNNKQMVLSIVRDVSERKITEEIIKESEKKFRTLFTEMKQAYALYKAIYDKKGVIEDALLVEVNPEYEKLVNMKREKIIGKKVTEILPHLKKRDVNLISLLGRTAITGETVITEYFNKDIGKWLLAKSFSPIKNHAAILFEDITEKRKIEIDLIANELKFRSIFNHSNDGYILRTGDGIVLEVNHKFLELFGYEYSEVISKNIKLINTHETEEKHKKIKKEIDEKGYAQFETMATRNDGSIFPIEVNAAKLLIDKEEVVFVIIRDITERNQAEEKLRRLNEELEDKVIQRTYQMETLYNIIKEISETFDLKEAMEIIAKYISELVDYDIIAQFITQEGLNHIHIEAPEGDKEAIDDFIKIAKEDFAKLNPDVSNNRDSATIIISDKKTIQNISSHISIPLIAEDKVVGFVVVGTEQKDAYIEEEIWFLYKIADNISHSLQRLKVILAAKDELETVLNHTSDGVILLNNNESVVMSNKAGSRFLTKIKDSKTDGINNEILDLEELKQIDKKELSLKGNTYYVSMSPIKTDFVHGWLLTAHDITEERTMQKKILHQDRLAILGKMTGGIAHDFNNILASIIGAADFSLMNADNIESKEFLNLIIKQSERGASLIRQMLDFTRQSMIKPKPVSMLDFITEFSRVIRSSLPENITLSVNTQDWTVFMDQVQLQQLFMNLILNSRDALVSGGKIKITVEKINHSKVVDFEEIEIEKNRDYIYFIIEDNGEGMSEQTKNMIFEPFFTTKDPGKGSGLGLAQVYGIVRKSNGYINVESELKVGTKVHIYIPKCEELVEEEIVESAYQGEGRILLVEDDEDVREITKMMLENYGYIVVTAENGKKALDLYNDSFDLVLTDIIMPVMGGEKLIENLLEINPQIKCLAMTGYSDVHVPEGIKVLNKPMITSKLVNYIQNELDQENYQDKKFSE